MEKETDFNKIHKNLTDQLENYINAILIDYSKFIPLSRKNDLSNIRDYSNIIKIHDYGSINGSASLNRINMPLSADKVLKAMSKIEGYGSNRNHKTYDSNNLIINDNTFKTYIDHVFISGTTTEEYYEDLLLHETMHFCGSGGGSALKEGINELLTRKIALKRNFKTNGCAYPKEVKIAYELQYVFGEDAINQIAFLNNNETILNYLKTTLGEDACNLHENVSRLMEKEFQEKYYKFINSYDGINVVLEKANNYEKINYDSVYNLINKNYKNSNNKKI